MSAAPSHPLPPIGGHAPPLRCGYLTAWPDEASQCPNDARWHIIWTSDVENSIDCDEHAESARRRYAFYAIHEYRMECSMPGAVFNHDLNRCEVDEGLLELDGRSRETRDLGASR